jgi:tripartite-type tricarboxylate transporter receptor subunit TctC
MRKGSMCGLVMCFVLTSVILANTDAVTAQEKFPTKPITLIVPNAPGSGMDMEARGIAPYVQKHLGVTVTIENVPGAQTKIGMVRAWKAKPDGYTSVVITMPTPILVEKTMDVEYRTRDFKYVYGWSKNVVALFVHGETWKTFDEFLKSARKETLSCGVATLWSVPHLGGIVFADALGLKVNFVPYDGAGEVLTSLAGKHIDFAINMIPAALPLVRAGKIRPLLVLADSEEFYPGVPIPKKAGYNIDVIASIRGIAAPPNTPSDRIRILETAFSKAVQEKQYLEWAQKAEIPISPTDSKQFTESTGDMYKIVEKYSGMLKSK